VTDKTVPAAFRLEPELLKRVDRFAKKFEAANLGIRLDRTASVRVLLLRALAQVEEPPTSGKKRAQSRPSSSSDLAAHYALHSFQPRLELVVFLCTPL